MINNDFIRDVTVLIITFTCVGVFVATAIASVLDLFNLLKLASDIRKKLHTVLLVEIVGISLAAFSGFMNPSKVVKKFDSVQKENTESTTSLLLFQAAAAGGPGKETRSSVPSFELAAIRTSVQRASAASVRGSKVLWIDDNPTNQDYERQALQQLGVEFFLAKNTNEALSVLKTENIQVVITDFSRTDDPQGGYTILNEAKKIKPSIPIIIYSASANPQYIEDAKNRGAFGETNRPQDLFNMVIDAIKR